jgi:Autotransporter beta-domain
MRFALNKCALMLTAATAALISGGSAFAQCTITPPPTANNTNISTEITTPVDTACADAGNAGNIVIVETTGSVQLSADPFVTAAVTIDSSNTVTNNNIISYTGVDDAVAVQIDAGGYTGQLMNASGGQINIEGDGTDETGILVALPTGATSGTFTGEVVPTFGTDLVAIDLAVGSSITMEGTSSFAIQTQPATQVVGDIVIAGTITMTPSTATAVTTGTGQTAILIAEPTTNPGSAYAMIGNINIISGGAVSVSGQGATGIDIQGGIQGAIINGGDLSTFGTATPNSAVNADDPEAGSALIIANSVTGGIVNEGPTDQITGTSIPSATISTTGISPTIDISSGANTVDAVPITIGDYEGDPQFGNTSTYSLINRGTIGAASEDPNFTTGAISLSGTTDAPVTLSGGIYNSGQITASASTNTSVGGSAAAVTIDIGNAVTVTSTNATTEPALMNDNSTGSGIITASVGGATTQTSVMKAIAVFIAAPNGSIPGGSLPSLINYGTIEAAVATSDNTVGSLTAVAIDDASGSLTSIINQGTISATATELTSQSQIAQAVNVGANSSGVTFTNNGTVIGDIVFGVGSNTLTDAALNPGDPTATINGNIYFGGDGTTPDNLTIGSAMTGEPGSFAGSVVEETLGGAVNVTIYGNGTMTLENSTIPVNGIAGIYGIQDKAAPLVANNFQMYASGTLNILVSQAFNQGSSTAPIGAIIEGQNVNIADNSNISVNFGSYLSSLNNGPIEVGLISTPSATATNPGIFTISSNEIGIIQNNTLQSVPFLFTENLCTFNIATATTAQTCAAADPALTAPTNGQQEIVLGLAPKSAAQIGLTGYAATLFPYVNKAIVQDLGLGAAVIDVGEGTTTHSGPLTAAEGQALYQQVYSEFAPDVSGATRATAISLTDSATDIVSDRQRTLRMYANQEGDTTIWGQEFAQRLNQDYTAGTIGYNDTGFGFAMGMDTGDPVDGRYGGAFTFFAGQDTSKEPVFDKTDSQWYLATGYTDWRGRGLFLDTQITAGYGNLTGQRFITLTPSTGNGPAVTRGAYDTRGSALLAGGLTTGAIFDWGGTVFTPQLSLDGLTMREEGYSETDDGVVIGPDAYLLHVQPYYANSARAFLGFDVRQDINFGGFFLQPSARAGYRYDFLDGAEKLSANFEDVTPVSQFSIEGPDPSKGNFVLGGGIATTTGAWSVGVNYDYLRATSGNTQQDGMLTLVGRI